MQKKNYQIFLDLESVKHMHKNQFNTSKKLWTIKSKLYNINVIKGEHCSPIMIS